MNSIALSPNVTGSTKTLDSILISIKSLFIHKDAVQTDFKVNEDQYPSTYNVIVMENRWVKDVVQHIHANELIKLLPAGYCDLSYIDHKIETEKQCFIKKRIGLFKKLEFNITGIWDYY